MYNCRGAEPLIPSPRLNMINKSVDNFLDSVHTKQTNNQRKQEINKSKNPMGLLEMSQLFVPRTVFLKGKVGLRDQNNLC